MRTIAALFCVGFLACSSSSSNGSSSPANDGGVGGGADASNADGGACSTPPATDPLASQRHACAFKAGDSAATTLGFSDADRAKIPIKHVVVMMKENRSFDHMLGGLKKLQPDADVADARFTNKDKSGASVAPYHLPTTCVGNDPDHQWAAMHAQVNGGKMDGFVTSAAQSTGGDGHFVMGYYDERDLPFYHFLASTFAISDRHFASVRSGTFPNRDYMLLGTSDNVASTQFAIWPDPKQPSIFDLLDAAHVTWGVYGDDHQLEETLNIPSKNFETTRPWSPVSKLIEAFANDTVPNVVFVDGTENDQDEHPTADVQVGEAWTKKIYDAAVASKAWSSTVLFLTYDEAGGFADHVPPREDACLARPEDGKFHELGVRVPFIAISPWARRHHVSHAEQDHTSITRFIEAVFGLPALTARDANADGLLGLFDFSCAPQPVPTAPAAVTKGCGGGAFITLPKTSFASGEAITVTFGGGPGNAKDWIAVYPRTDTPHSGSTLWAYCATNNHTATTQAVTMGTVTLDASSANNTTSWPLAAGTSWTAYYLVNDGYTSIASV